MPTTERCSSGPGKIHDSRYDRYDRQSIEIQGHTNADTYEMDFECHLKRIRIEFGGEVIVDSTQAMVLRKPRHLPTFYFPRSDIRMDLLHPMDHITHCPY